MSGLEVDMTFEDNPAWKEIANTVDDADAVNRQIRIMIAAGKKAPQLMDWLIKKGHSTSAAKAILKSIPEYQDMIRPRGRSFKLGLVASLLFSIIVTVIYRPWNETWVDAFTGRTLSPVEPILYWFIGLSATSVTFGFVCHIFGVVFDWIRGE